MWCQTKAILQTEHELCRKRGRGLRYTTAWCGSDNVLFQTGNDYCTTEADAYVGEWYSGAVFQTEHSAVNAKPVLCYRTVQQ